MTTAVIVGIAMGLLAAAWAILFLAFLKTRNVIGEAVSALLAVAVVTYYLLPNDIAPEPGEVARSMGWIATPSDAIVTAVALVIVWVGVTGVAYWTGVVSWAAGRIDHTARG